MTTPVCVITNAYPDYEGSYHGIFVRRTVEDMAERRWLSHVLAPRLFKQSEPFQEYPTHTVTRFPFPSAQKLLIEYDPVPVFRISALVASGVFSATRLVVSRGCRLIHAHWALPAGLIGLAASKLTGRKLILTVHGSDWRLAHERGGLPEFLFKRVALGSARIICVSQSITDYLLRLGLDEKRLVTFPMGVDERIFGISVREHESPGEKELSVISTRNHLPLYRLKDLFEAALRLGERITDFKLTIAGQGSQSEELKEFCSTRGLGDRVTFTGRMEPERLARLLGQHRIYVSTSPAEGSSVSLLEAMACGCLPVVTDIPANREWITHESNGLLYPVGDTKALAEQIFTAARDDKLLQRAKNEGPRIVARRGLWSAQIEILDACYRTALQK